MFIKTFTSLVIFGLFFAIQGTQAQDDIKIKIMNATHIENHQVVVAVKTAGEKDPLIIEVVELGAYRDYSNIAVPNTAELFLFIVPAGTSLDKRSPVPSEYASKMKALGMDGVKGCNIVVSGDNIDDVHYNMTNIQW